MNSEDIVRIATKLRLRGIADSDMIQDGQEDLLVGTLIRYFRRIDCQPWISSSRVNYEHTFKVELHWTAPSITGEREKIDKAIYGATLLEALFKAFEQSREGAE